MPVIPGGCLSLQRDPVITAGSRSSRRDPGHTTGISKFISKTVSRLTWRDKYFSRFKIPPGKRDSVLSRRENGIPFHPALENGIPVNKAGFRDFSHYKIPKSRRYPAGKAGSRRDPVFKHRDPAGIPKSHRDPAGIPPGSRIPFP